MEIRDTSATIVNVVLSVETQVDGLTEPEPLLLVRTPSQNGFPALDREGLSDYAAIRNKSSEQSILVPISTSCTGRNCYKISVHNRHYAENYLSFTLQAIVYSETAQALKVVKCGQESADTLNCNERGKCVQTATGPTCVCDSGWSGLNCNSPTTFEVDQMRYALQNIELLCR